MKKIVFGFLFGACAAGIVSGVNGVIRFLYPDWLSFPPSLLLVAQVSFIEEAIKLAVMISVARKTPSFLMLGMMGVGFGIAEMVLYWFSLHSLNIASLLVHPLLGAVMAGAVIWVMRGERKVWWYGAILMSVFVLHFLWNYQALTSLFPIAN